MSVFASNRQQSFAESIQPISVNFSKMSIVLLLCQPHTIFIEFASRKAIVTDHESVETWKSMFATVTADGSERSTEPMRAHFQVVTEFRVCDGIPGLLNVVDDPDAGRGGHDMPPFVSTEAKTFRCASTPARYIFSPPVTELGEIADGILAGGLHAAKFPLLPIRQFGLLGADMQCRANTGLNKGQAHHALRVGRQGDIHDRSSESTLVRLGSTRSRPSSLTVIPPISMKRSDGGNTPALQSSSSCWPTSCLPANTGDQSVTSGVSVRFCPLPESIREWLGFSSQAMNSAMSSCMLQLTILAEVWIWCS